MDIPHLVRVARNEAARMQAAIADADDTAKVNMEVRQFAKIAELLDALGAIASAPAPAALHRPLFAQPDKETPMEANNSMQRPRTLAQIESDMVAAEGAYSEADGRLKQAQHDRDTALAALNKHQSELDAAVARLRERSPVDSIWQGQAANPKGVLMLEHEAASREEAALVRAAEEPAGPAGEAQPADDAPKAGRESRRSGAPANQP